MKKRADQAAAAASATVTVASSRHICFLAERAGSVRFTRQLIREEVSVMTVTGRTRRAGGVVIDRPAIEAAENGRNPKVSDDKIEDEARDGSDSPNGEGRIARGH